ncbi:MAG TPA: dihydroorotate dehydrogenase, partial [Acidobacteria bacterium]|nr:dihydroorotate dehydrogenase [Acidobacteriota bacterium]
VAKKIEIPVIGLGGIFNAQDALEFMVAGASAVQVGTANFVNPLACPEIIKGIEDWAKSQGISSLSEIVGSLKV